MDELQLKPCPFCGGEAAMAKGNCFFVIPKYYGRLRVVGCKECGCMGGMFNTLALSEEEAEKKAIASWESRCDNG